MLDLYAATRNETLRVDLKTEISAFAVENDFVTRFTSLVVVAAQTRKRRSKEKQRQIRELFEQYAQNEKIVRPDQEWFFSNRHGFLWKGSINNSDSKSRPGCPISKNQIKSLPSMLAHVEIISHGNNCQRISSVFLRL